MTFMCEVRHHIFIQSDLVTHKIPSFTVIALLLLSDECLDIALVVTISTMTSEAEKLSSHLALLRTEYVKLQQKCTKLERDLAVVSAQVRLRLYEQD